MSRPQLMSLLVFACTTQAFACIWTDDIDFDRELGLPPLEAILAGRFERHSQAYWDRVIEREQSRMTTQNSTAREFVMPRRRHLAAALLIRGDLEGAKAAIISCVESEPDSAPAYAMAGTICLARDEHEQAIVLLRRSIELSPKPLFGREPFELMLAEYLQRRQIDPATRRRDPTFVRPLLRRVAGVQEDGSKDNAMFQTAVQSAEVDQAINAIAAMIRFGHPRSAHLYAAIGDLLRFRGDAVLADRAFRRALEAGKADSEFVEAQRRAVQDSASGNARLSDALVTSERREADDWVEKFQSFESALLQHSEETPPASAYAPFYAKHGNPRVSPHAKPVNVIHFARRHWQPLTVVALLIIGLIVIRVRHLRRLSAAG